MKPRDKDCHGEISAGQWKVPAAVGNYRYSWPQDWASQGRDPFSERLSGRTTPPIVIHTVVHSKTTIPNVKSWVKKIKKKCPPSRRLNASLSR